MGKVMIIGAGGVATATAYQLVKVPEVFEEVLIASRTKEKCDTIVQKINKGNFHTAQIDAMKVDELVSLINDFKPDMVLHLALPYQNLAIMGMCANRCFQIQPVMNRLTTLISTYRTMVIFRQI